MNTETKTPDFSQWHRELGCAKCKFANPLALNRGPCCYNPKGPDGRKDGTCKNMVPKK